MSCIIFYPCDALSNAVCDIPSGLTCCDTVINKITILIKLVEITLLYKYILKAKRLSVLRILMARPVLVILIFLSFGIILKCRSIVPERKSDLRYGICLVINLCKVNFFAVRSKVEVTSFVSILGIRS